MPEMTQGVMGDMNMEGKSITCDCGRTLEPICQGWRRGEYSCECGAEFDSGGRALASVEFWGEETGESFP